MKWGNLKKTNNSIFLTTFFTLFLLSNFIFPQKTSAQVFVPTNDYAANITLGAIAGTNAELAVTQTFFNSSIWTKEYVLDLAAYTAANAALNTISIQLQNKILNSLGNFVKSLKDELLDLENLVGSKLGIEIDAVNGCFPNVDFSPVPMPAWNPVKFNASITCSAASGLEMNAFYKPGGFNGASLKKLSVDPARYNAFGSFVVVQEELTRRKQNAKEVELQELAWGRGLRAVRDAATGLIKTPAAAVQKQLDNAFSLQLDRMKNADETTEILVSVISAMVSSYLTPQENSAERYAPSPDRTPPTTPTNIAATAISTSEIKITWGPSTDDVKLSGYMVYRDDSFLGVTLYKTFVDAMLEPNTLYNYKVTAIDTSGNESSYSASVSESSYPTGQ